MAQAVFVQSASDVRVQQEERDDSRLGRALFRGRPHEKRLDEDRRSARPFKGQRLGRAQGLGKRIRCRHSPDEDFEAPGAVLRRRVEMTRPKCDRAMLQQLAGPAVVQQEPQAGIDDEQRGRKALEDRDEGAPARQER